MRRASLVIALALAALPSFPCRTPAAEVERAPSLIDGSGMVDFTKRPTFKVGDWVRYRTTGASLQGHKDDYVVTTMIAGEEIFWGEPCFWVETWTQPTGSERRGTTASLVSYAAFGDTMARKHIFWFLRKTINGLNSDGQPEVAVYTREGGELRLRQANWEKDQSNIQVDSLGPDTVNVPAGRFDAFKVLRKSVHAETVEKGDSTIYYERRYEQTFYYTDAVPITRLAKIKTDDLQQGKTWMAGQFDRAALKVLERVDGQTVLLEHGSGGVTPSLVPAAARRSIDRKAIEQALALPAEPPVKPLKR